MAIDPTADNQFLTGIIVRGHDKDPSPNEDGLASVYLPGHHGNLVRVSDLGFSPMIMPPNQSGATEFNGVPDPGQHVLCMKTGAPGDSALIILGTIPTVRQDGGNKGNMNLNTAFKAMAEAFATEINVRVPPNAKETKEGGTRIRKIEEKGQKHKHDLLKGIPSHGAIYTMAGMPMKQITNVSTATQAFTNILTGDMMSALPGSIFSVGNILNSLTSSLQDELLSSMPPGLAQGVQNMFTLMQSVETAESGSFATAGRVDPTTYLNNAMSLLKGNQSMGEVISNLQRLQFDSSLFGLENLPATAFQIATAFGTQTMSLSATGAIETIVPDEMKTAIDIFNKLMGNPLQFPGAPGMNMFGASSAVMSEMFNRLPTNKQTIAKNMMEQAVGPGSSPRVALNKMTEIARAGSNIMDIIN